MRASTGLGEDVVSVEPRDTGLLMRIETEAIVCAVRAHGEHGAIVRALTADHGMLVGYLRGGRSRRLKPLAMAGNVVRGEWRARTDAQLAALTIELVESRAPLLAEPLPATAIDWATALAATALPEQQPYPGLHSALDGLLAAIVAAPAARDWAAAIVRFELLLLSELGFGLDLSGCAQGGAGPIAYVSPRTGVAVGHEHGEPYRDRLLAVPAFLSDSGIAGGEDVLAGLRLTGHFLARDILQGRAAEIFASRERLIDRLARMG